MALARVSCKCWPIQRPDELERPVWEGPEGSAIQGDYDYNDVVVGRVQGDHDFNDVVINVRDPSDGDEATNENGPAIIAAEQEGTTSTFSGLKRRLNP